MKATQAMYAATWLAAVSAFVLVPHARLSRFSCAFSTPEITAPVPLSRLARQAHAVEHTASETAESCSLRSTKPVVLVSSVRKNLDAFAEHLAVADDSISKIVDLGEIAASDGARGVELALASSKADRVFLCSSELCLKHPDVQSVIHAHPLTVHLATEGEDAASRERCEQATKYTVVVDDNEEEKAFAKIDLSRLVAFARKPKPSPADIKLDMGKNTFFLSLTFPDFEPHTDLLPDLTEGADALELRVDLLADHDPYSVLKQLSILRRHMSYLPIVFTIRSKGQCGAFPDDPDALFRLARWGLRAGCEVMDIEANWPMSYREGLIQEASRDYPGAVLVGSYHVVGKKTTEEQARKMFMECYHDGAVDAVKVRCVQGLGERAAPYCSSYGAIWACIRRLYMPGYSSK